MAYRLLAADYDLTLSLPDHTVSDAVRGAIRRVFETGRYVTLATGRLGSGAEGARALIPGDVPLILCNGGVLASAADGAVLSETVMDPETAVRVMEWCARFPGTTVVWCRDGLFADRMNEAAEIYARLSFCAPRLLPSRETAGRSGVHKILLLSTVDTVERAWETLRRETPFPVNSFPSTPGVLEIVPPGVDKGSGLARAAALLGIPREEVIAVGDGENDIPMLRWAGLGVAMGNAPESVKAAADIVCPPCDEDGAAWVMENYLL